MKKKWIKIELKDGAIEEIDYGWQCSYDNKNNELILTRVKDGVCKRINNDSIERIIYNSI